MFAPRGTDYLSRIGEAKTSGGIAALERIIGWSAKKRV